ncbi:MAG: tetratricopeptide repeat protein, partial [Proteobacteria bacterium]|nr:tetratricopeptide repeat protein [Pseudomonadota bacterium]
MRHQVWRYWQEPNAAPIELTRKGLVEMIARQEADPDAFVQPPGDDRCPLCKCIGTRDLAANLRAAKAAYEANQLPEALTSYDYALAFNDRILAAQFYRGMVHLRTGNYEFARRALQRCLDNLPLKSSLNRSVILNNLGVVSVHLDDPIYAEQCLEEAITCNDAVAEAYYNLLLWARQASAFGFEDGSSRANELAEKAHKLFSEGRSSADAALLYP